MTRGSHKFVSPCCLEAKDLEHLPHPTTNRKVHHEKGPTISMKAKGVYLWDNKGSQYWSWPDLVDMYPFEKEVSEMPKSGPPYPAEYRRKLVELVRVGRSPEDLVRQLEPSSQNIRNWVAHADRDDSRRTDALGPKRQPRDPVHLRRGGPACPPAAWTAARADTWTGPYADKTMIRHLLRARRGSKCWS